MKNLYLRVLIGICLLVGAYSSNAQCPGTGGPWTPSTLNWENLDFLPSNDADYTPSYIGTITPYFQRFTMGTRRVEFTMASTTNFTLNGENATNTAHAGSNAPSGSDVQFTTSTTSNRTITINFDAEVGNLNFSIFDLDNSQRVTITASNALGVVVPVLTEANAGGAIAILANQATGPAVNYADNNNFGTLNVSIPGLCNSLTITLNNAAGDIWLSDLNACVTGSFPTGWRNVSQPFTGMPSYILTVVDNIFYLLDPATGKMKWLFTDVAHTNMNGMAYDPYNRYLYYTHSLTSNPANTRTIYRYNANTGGISTWVADINLAPLNIPTYRPGVTSGSASFYNGSLYFGVEASNSSRNSGRENTVWKIDFDGTAAQNPVRASQVYATRVDSNVAGDDILIHDWSDIGVTNNGMLYDFDGAGAGTPDLDTIYYHFNMMTGNRVQFMPNGVGNIGPKQTAIDWQENVYNMGGLPSQAGSGPGQTQDIGGFIVPYNYNGTVNNAQNRLVYFVQGGSNVFPTGSWGDCSEAFRPLCDFGDAPATYDPNPLSPAVNEQDTMIRIGSTFDREWLKTSSAAANGDGADEDGVGTVPFMAPGNGGWACQVVVYNHTGSPATLRGWLDFNGNGVFDAAENVATATFTVPSSTANQTFTLYWPNTPNTFTNGQATYARIRITNSAVMGAANATGYYENGETEDYRVLIDNFPLTVNLMSFSARAISKDKVRLDWNTTGENNFTGFEIMRSADNNNWTSLGTVLATGNGSTNTNMYAFTDERPLKGRSYYYLKLLNNDGKYRNTEVRAIMIQEEIEELVIYPNPAVDKAFLSIESNIVTMSTVSVSDMSGKIIYWQNMPIYQGMNKIELPVGKYAESGVYMVRMSMNDKTYTRKLIVSK
jgi:hypothetical protein